jgi:hypothetical protein
LESRVRATTAVWVAGAALLLASSCAQSPLRQPSSEISSGTALDSETASGKVESDKIDLRSLYPELSDAAFKRKLDGAPTTLRFLRSFAPAYYRAFTLQKKSFHPRLRRAAEFQGWCAGDAHPENFGTLLDDSGKAAFTLIDLDDSGYCSVFSDILHLMLATRLQAEVLSDRESLQRILEAYLDGAAGRVKLSKPVRDLLSRAEDKDYFDDNLDDFDSEVQVLAKNIPLNERRKLADAFSSDFGDVTISRATRFAKTTGGSAGQIRHRAILGKGEDPVVLEFRTLATPAVHFERYEPFDPRNRTLEALKMTAPQGRSKWYAVRELNGKWTLASPRLKGTRAVDLKKDSDQDPELMLKIVRDEAAVLGELHSRGTSGFASYLRAIRDLQSQDWEQALNAMESALERIRKRP